MNKFVLVAATLFVMSSSFSAFSAQMVVVGVEGTAPVALGDVIDDASPITLGEGVALTVINSSGQKLRIAGPRSGLLTAEVGTNGTSGGAGVGAGVGAEYDVVKSLAGLFKSEGDSKSLGAFRAAVARVPGPWMYDVDAGEKYCVGAGQTPKLWRKSARNKEEVTVADAAGKTSKTLIWRTGKSTLQWPASVPVADSGKYLIRIGRKGQPQPVTAYMMPDELPSPAHQAAWMVDRGCLAQARLLIVTTNID